MSVIEISFDGSLNKEQLEIIQKIMDKSAEYWNNEVLKVMEEYNLSYKGASDVLYLRSRSRWSKENEENLIKIYQSGDSVNIFDWP